MRFRFEKASAAARDETRGSPGRAGYSATSATHGSDGVPCAPAFVVPARILRGVALRPDAGETRLELQPGGPFAVMVLRNGTLGEHLAIIYHGPMPNVHDGAWTLDDRWWQDSLWSAHANAMVWSPDGTALYVSTGNRGSGGVFRLDLRNRRASRVWPNDDASTPEQGIGRSCEIMSADAARRLLHVRYQPSATQRPIAVDVWMK